MNVIERIKNLLEVLSVPVEYMHYEGKSHGYIRFKFNGEEDTILADDEQEDTAHIVQFDIFSKDESIFLTLCEQLKITIKKDKRFIRKGVSPDLYENRTKLYHRAYRYLYIIDPLES